MQSEREQTLVDLSLPIVMISFITLSKNFLSSLYSMASSMFSVIENGDSALEMSLLIPRIYIHHFLLQKDRSRGCSGSKLTLADHEVRRLEATNNFYVKS